MARNQNRRRPATHDDDRRRNVSAAGKCDGSLRPAHGFWTSERLCLLAVAGLLTLAVALTFAQAAGFAFINLDNGDYVFGNPKVSGGLSWDGIRWAFTKSHMENWHPLTWISLMLDCNLYGLNPAGLHLTNVVLQAAVAVLLFLVLRAMTGGTGSASGTLWPSAGGGAVCDSSLAGRIGGLGDGAKGRPLRAVLRALSGGLHVLCAAAVFVCPVLGCAVVCGAWGCSRRRSW